MRISKQEEKQCRCPGFLHTDFHHCRVRIESSDQLWCKNEYHNTDQLRQQCCHENPKPCALFCALMLFCTQILADKGGHCHRETGNRQKAKPFNLGKGSDTCHRHLAKRVDVGLYHYIGKCDN